MRLRLEGPSLASLPLDPVINHFAGEKNRRVDFLSTTTIAITAVAQGNTPKPPVAAAAASIES